jgi:hypothetical protein
MGMLEGEVAFVPGAARGQGRGRGRGDSHAEVG